MTRLLRFWLWLALAAVAAGCDTMPGKDPGYHVRYGTTAAPPGATVAAAGETAPGQGTRDCL